MVTAVGLPLTDLFLVRGQDPTLAYWITGMLSVIGGATAMAMTEPPIGPRQTTREITVGAIRDVITRPAIWRLILYSVGVFILLRAAMVIFLNPVLAESGVPVGFYGTALALTNIAGACDRVEGPQMAQTVRRTRSDHRHAGGADRHVRVAAFMRVPAVVAVFCVQGAVFGAYPLVIRTMLNRHVASAARRATTISLESMACRIAFGLIVGLSGWSLELWGLTPTMVLTTLAGCLPLLFLIFRRA